MKIFLLLFFAIVCQQIVGQQLQVSSLFVSASDNVVSYESKNSVLEYKKSIKTINLHLDLVDGKSQNEGSTVLIVAGALVTAGTVFYLISQQLSFVNSLGDSRINKKGVLLGLGLGGGFIVGGIALQKKKETE